MSHPPASRRIAVKGLGAISALAADLPGTWAAMLDGRTGIAPFLPGRTAAAARGFDGGGLNARRLGQLDRGAQLAVAAAREAWAAAAVPAGDPARRAAVLGAPPGLETLDQAYKRLYGEGNPRVHPLTVPRGMPSAGASAVSAEFGLPRPQLRDRVRLCLQRARDRARGAADPRWAGGPSRGGGRGRATYAGEPAGMGGAARAQPGSLPAVLGRPTRPGAGRGRRRAYPGEVGERRSARRPDPRGAGPASA